MRISVITASHGIEWFPVNEFHRRPGTGDKLHIPLFAHATQHALKPFEHQFFIVNKKNSPLLF
jgi:hypothetical protein